MINLSKMRKDKGLFQSDIAKECGISRQHYSRIENGLRSPSVKVAKNIAEVLEFDWTDFYKEKEQK